MNEMEMKARLIVDDTKNEEGTSPVAIFKRMAKKEYGPEKLLQEKIDYEISW